MKVLLIDVNCKHSSTGKIVYDLYQGINASGNTAAICYGRGPIVDGLNIYKFSSNLEVKIHALLTRITGLTGIYSPFATRNLLRFMDKFKPDVVHIHELHGYFVNIAPVINYLKKRDIKTVWTFHCEFMYTGKCGQSYDCEKWKTECYDCPLLHDYPNSLFFDFTREMHQAKKKLFNDFQRLTIITPSLWLKNRIQDSFLHEFKIIVIYNGVNTNDVFYHRNFDTIQETYGLKNKKVVLSVAPNIMSEQKGGKLILELAKRFGKEEAVFVLIGVDKKIESCNENVILLGRTKDQNELAIFYSMAKITLIMSKRETFSLVCAESLACGTPVIGFESGAPSEIVPNGFGSFVDNGDLDNLELLLKESLGNDAKFLSQSAISDFAKTNYSNEKMVSAYIDLYYDRTSICQ